MKKTIFSLLFVLSFCSAAFAMRNEPDEFRSIKMKENLKIGDLDINKIVYTFDDRGFFLISVWLKTRNKIESRGRCLHKPMGKTRSCAEHSREERVLLGR